MILSSQCQPQILSRALVNVFVDPNIISSHPCCNSNVIRNYWSYPQAFSLAGTCFYLNEDTAHPLLAILDDGFTISCDELENPECDLPVYDNSFTRYSGAFQFLWFF